MITLMDLHVHSTKLGCIPSMNATVYRRYCPKIYLPIAQQDPINFGVAGPTPNGAGKLGWFYPLYASIEEALARDTELGGSGPFICTHL